MQDSFDSELRGTFNAASKDRGQIELLKGLSREDREGVATRIAAMVPQRMEELRELVAREWGVDISDPNGGARAERSPRTLTEAMDLLNSVNLFRVYEEHAKRLDAHAADSSLSRQELAAMVCQTGVEMFHALEAAKLHALREIRVWAESTGSEEAALAKDAEARNLAAHLAIRISMRNKRLASALDEYRHHKKPASRERFDALLRELYVLAPEVWDGHHSNDWGLFATRTSAVKKIERGVLPAPAPPPEEAELASFANRERLLKRGRDASLPPREFQILELLVENPRITSAGIAQRLGISASAVRTLKSRIKKALDAA